MTPACASPWVERELSCGAQAPGIGISMGTAVLFWLFARAVFEDGFRLRVWHGALWAPAPPAEALGALECRLMCDPEGFDRTAATPRWVGATVGFFRRHLLR